MLAEFRGARRFGPRCIRPCYSPDWYTHLTETLFARCHRNLTLTITLKIAIMYAVRVTKTNFNIVLYIKVIFLGTGLG